MAHQYIHIPITQQLRQVSLARAAALPIYAGSHRGRAANLIGCLGETVVSSWLTSRGLQPATVGLIDHDMELEYPDGRTLHFDIKTKDRTVRPSPGYEATVPAYVYDKQAPHYYVFVSLYRERSDPGRRFTDAYIVGAIARRAFDSLKYFEPAGLKPNGANFFCDAWNVQIRSLDEPMSFPPKAVPEARMPGALTANT